MAKESKTSQQLNELAKNIDELKKEMMEFKEMFFKKEEKVKEEPIQEVIKKANEEITQPVPMEYRQLVDSVLNRKFGIKVNYYNDRSEFMFTIVVPEDYSSLSEKEKMIVKADLRSKVITYAEGINGIRAWAELVYKSFRPEIQAKIVVERI